MTEHLARYQPEESVAVSLEPSALLERAVFGLVRAYWGNSQANGGRLGFSTHLEQGAEPQRLAVQQAVAGWKRDIQPRLR